MTTSVKKKTVSPHIASALTKLGQDKVLLKSVINVIVEQWPAEERLLKKAVLEKNHEQLKKSFHTLGGSVSYFSLELSKEFHELSSQAALKSEISEKKLAQVLVELDALIEELKSWSAS